MSLVQKILSPKKALINDMRAAAEIVTEVLLEVQFITKPDTSLELIDGLELRR